LRPPAETAAATGVLDPALLDAALQAAAGIAMRGPAGHGTYLPFALGGFEIFAPVRGPCHAHARLTRADEALLMFDVAILDSAGKMLARFRDLAARAQQDAAATGVLLYRSVWREASSSPRAASSRAMLAFGSDPLIAHL